MSRNGDGGSHINHEEHEGHEEELQGQIQQPRMARITRMGAVLPSAKSASSVAAWVARATCPLGDSPSGTREACSERVASGKAVGLVLPGRSPNGAGGSPVPPRWLLRFSEPSPEPLSCPHLCGLGVRSFGRRPPDLSLRVLRLFVVQRSAEPQTNVLNTKSGIPRSAAADRDTPAAYAPPKKMKSGYAVDSCDFWSLSLALSWLSRTGPRSMAWFSKR